MIAGAIKENGLEAAQFQVALKQVEALQAVAMGQGKQTILVPANALEAFGKTVQTGVFPIGIDVDGGTAAIIEAGKKLQVIARAGGGIDNIDVDAATRYGIVVINAPTGNTVSAAEHAIALMLTLSRNIPQANAALKSGQLKPGYTREQLNQALADKIPADDEVYIEKSLNRETGRMESKPLLLKKKVLMTGDAVKNATVRIGDYNEPYVSVDFNRRGAAEFGRITGENVKRRLAIILDGTVRSAPTIKERIGGGKAQITGSYTPAEGHDLAIVLRAGALPATVKIVQNITVGPTLGADSIKKGLTAGLIATILVIGFMIFYYRFSGVVANYAMILNVILLLGALSLLGATLTLPGIAGIILSIGMAVDSNVLIYERMREEFHAGKPLKAGIDGGYDKAFWTIIDSHVTTLITACALFLFGTGPIKGFAVTLIVGLCISMITAIYVTRLVFESYLSANPVEELSI